MLLLLLKRALRAVILALVVTFVVFSMVYGNASGIARQILGIRASEAQVQEEIVRLGLDQPLITQYLHWLGGVVTGTLGKSYFTGQPVTSTLAISLPVTLSLVLVSLFFTILLSVIIGVAAAVYGGWLDRFLQFMSVLGAAVPAFISGVALAFLFAIQIHLFPATGYVPIQKSFGAWTASVALPVLAILITSIGSAASQFRSAVMDVMSQDFVRTLRARGMSEFAITFRHILRNAGGPGLTVLSLQTIGLLGGVVVIEQVFALPGMGILVNTATQRGDIPVVMGIVLVTVIFVVIVNLISDAAGAALNPKVRRA
jgi:peptide/nickel transport system permease protein